MEREKEKRILYRRSIVAAGLVFCSFLMVFLARRNPEGVAKVFIPWSRSLEKGLSWLFSFTRLALAEFLLYALLLFTAASLAVTVVRMIRRRTVWFPLLRFLSCAALVAASLLFFFFSAWGLAYYAPPLAGQIELETGPAPVQTLYDTTVWLRDEMNALADKVPRNEDGVCSAGGFDALASRAPDGYSELARTGTAFDAAPLPPKRMTAATFMSKVGIAGIFVPFTGEAVVNPDATDAHLPFSMCHELAHRLGFAPEDEANYIAILACIENPDPVFSYSGYHLAFIYCSNALAGQDSELYQQLYSEISPLVTADFRAQRKHLAQYEGPMRDLGEAVNNNYLKSMDQPEGVKSYGKVVDLLIADYAARFGPG